MTAAAIASEDGTITRAAGVLDRAIHTIWPEGAFEVTAKAARDLGDAIETRAALASGALHWETYDADLGEYAEPHDVALTQSAHDAEERAAYLIEVIGTHISASAAEYVSGDAP